MTRRGTETGGTWPAELQVVDADVPVAVYDEWRRLMVLPRGLTEVEQGRVMRELFAERRGAQPLAAE